MPDREKSLAEEKARLDAESDRLHKLLQLKVRDTVGLVRDALLARPQTEEEWSRLSEGRPRAAVEGVQKLIEFSEGDPETRLVLTWLTEPFYHSE